MSGEQRRLDDEHKEMAAHIDNDFDVLYPTLIHHYNKTLQQLKQGPDITALHQYHYDLTYMMLHESEMTYGRLTINEFLNKINKWLVR